MTSSWENEMLMVFYDSQFDGNVDFDDGGDIGHVSLFKIIWGRDRVFELVYIP